MDVKKVLVHISDYVNLFADSDQLLALKWDSSWSLQNLFSLFLAAAFIMQNQTKVVMADPGQNELAVRNNNWK